MMSAFVVAWKCGPFKTVHIGFASRRGAAAERHTRSCSRVFPPMRVRSRRRSASFDARWRRSTSSTCPVWGGGVALHLALRRPELVDGLVLLAPAALGRSLHWIYKLYCLPLIGRALLYPRQSGQRGFVRRFLIGSLRRDDLDFVDMLVRHGDKSRQRALSTRAIVWANQPAVWRRFLMVLTPGGEQIAFAVGDRLKELSDVPTLVLWGNEDRVICAGDAVRCRDFHQRAEIHVARGVGHMLPLEASAWANAYIARFVQSLTPALRKAA